MHHGIMARDMTSDDAMIDKRPTFHPVQLKQLSSIQNDSLPPLGL